MIGIYKITSPTKKVYIGQSTNIKKRFSHYKGLNCKRQPIIYNSLLKYGVEKHKFEILCECSVEELNDKERYYQDVFSVIGKNGLNCSLTKTSDRSGKHSEETKFKLSKAHKGKKLSEETKLKMSKIRKGKPRLEETKLKISIGNKNSKNFLGKKHSEKTKFKMSNAKKGNKHNLGKKYSEEHKIKISEGRKKIILNIETGIFYFGVKEASEIININIWTLHGYLNGQRLNKTNLIYV